MQTTYSQNKEDLIVKEYFGDYKGNLLEIGANDGLTLSNSRLMIENGWSAYLLEPGSVCGDLQLLYLGLLPNIHIFNYGIGKRDATVKFWESGSHIPNGKDKGLVSTTDFEETKRWPNVDFFEREIQLVSWDNFYNYNEKPIFEFISIDVEGLEWEILQQIDLEKVGCRALIIEWNSKIALGGKFIQYCAKFGLHLKHTNAENLIFFK